MQSSVESKRNLIRPDVADEAEMKKYPYQNLIGALMFFSISTRPDITFAAVL